MSQQTINIKKILNQQLNDQHWSYLQKIIKDLQEYISKCSKNRQYLEAQKGTQKYAQAMQQLKKRKIFETNKKLTQSLQQLDQKHKQQNKNFQKEWKNKFEYFQLQFNQLQKDKKKKHQDQYERSKNQMELAIPQHHTPDNQLYKLKWEQQQYAKQAKFMEAQKIKQKIQQRQNLLNQRHKKFRQNNIKQMLLQLQTKHQNQLFTIQARKKQKNQQLKRERKKKLKQLQQKQAKQLRQIKWIYGQQMKRYY